MRRRAFCRGLAVFPAATMLPALRNDVTYRLADFTPIVNIAAPI